MKIKFYYLTTNGCEWLNETVDVESDNLAAAAADYVLRNTEMAERLVMGWRANGEDESMFPVGESLDGDSKVNRALCRIFDPS